MTGHLLGAVELIEAMIASILSMKYSIVPPTINHIVDENIILH
jgi:3-oxoacyl-[acyl-carrier-protein] synthase II